MVKHILVFLATAVTAFSQSQTLLVGADSTVQPAMMPKRDPGAAIVSSADHMNMSPYFDARGCPRWKLSGRNIVFIPLASRTAPRDRIHKAWAELAGWRARIADPLLSDPALLAYYQEELAKYQAAYDELIRPGKAEDDSLGPPAKTTISTQ